MCRKTTAHPNQSRHSINNWLLLLLFKSEHLWIVSTSSNEENTINQMWISFYIVHIDFYYQNIRDIIVTELRKYSLFKEISHFSWLELNCMSNWWKIRCRITWDFLLLQNIISGFSGGSAEPTCQCRRRGFGKILWRRAWQPRPVFLPGEFHGQRSLMGYISMGSRKRRTGLKRLNDNRYNFNHSTSVLCPTGRLSRAGTESQAISPNSGPFSTWVQDDSMKN